MRLFLFSQILVQAGYLDCNKLPARLPRRSLTEERGLALVLKEGEFCAQRGPVG